MSVISVHVAEIVVLLVMEYVLKIFANMITNCRIKFELGDMILFLYHVYIVSM